MADSAVTAAANAITQAQAAQTSKVGAVNTSLNSTILSSVKNSLFGTGSLSTTDAHVSSIQSNINNALKVDPKNANLIEAQKDMAAAAASKDAAAKTAALAAAQKALQNVYYGTSSTSSTTTKTTTPVVVAKTSPVVATVVTTKPLTTGAVATANNTSSLVSQSVATAQALSGSSSSSSSTLNSTVKDRVVNSLQGTGSLGTSDPHVSSILSNITTALKYAPNDKNLLAAQTALKSISSSTSSSAKAGYLATAKTSLNAVLSGGTTPTPTPNQPAPTPTPTPTPNQPAPTPSNSVDAAALSMESSVRNSLFGTGSFSTSALNYKQVSSNIASAIAQTKNIPTTSVVGNTTPNSWQNVASSLVSAQSNMAAALGNKGTDDAAGRARSSAFLAAKSDLSKADSMMKSLGYDNGKKIVL